MHSQKIHKKIRYSCNIETNWWYFQKKHHVRILPCKSMSPQWARLSCITMGSSLFRMEKPLYRNFLTYAQVKSRYEQGTFYFPALAKNALLEMDIYKRDLYSVCVSLNAACKNPSFQGNRIETQNCFYSKTI